MNQLPQPGDWGALGKLARDIRDYLFGWLPSKRTMRSFGRRIVYVIIAIFVAGFGAFGLTFWNLWRSKDVFEWLLAPADGKLSPFDGAPVFTNPTDPIVTALNVSMMAGIAAAFPVFVFGMFYIFRPITPLKYQRYFLIFAPVMFAVFIAGAMFAYYVLLEVSLDFLISFGEGVAVPLITLSQYISLITMLMFWMGTIFQIPIVMYLLARMHVLGYAKMKKIWPFVVVSLMVFAGIITPTVDPWTWALVAGPMLLLYQLGLFLMWTVEPDEGNYLFVKSFWNLIMWAPRRVGRGFLKLRGAY